METAPALTLVILLCGHLQSALGAVEPTFEHCCRLGSRSARDGQECTVGSSPVPGVVATEQAMCRAVKAICCVRKQRQKQCSAGTEAAKNQQPCLLERRIPAREHFKDCCEGCKLGLVVGPMGMGCSFSRFKFGHPWENSFVSCCSDRSAVDPAIPAIHPVLPPAGGRVVDSDSENICDLFVGQLCAHLCVSVPGSYRCECRPGFVLGPDAKSCTLDPDHDRCQESNPCAHVCTDTGTDIQCSCKKGFQLAPDQVNCLDVDECLQRIDKCQPGHMCFNEPGAYGCLERTTRLVYRPEGATAEDPEDSEDPEDTEDGLHEGGGVPQCPDGFTINPEKQLCDDVDECLDPGTCGDLVCVNSIGSFRCESQINPCPAGFVFNPNLQTCVDIDECLEGLSTCDPTAEFCINTQGSFTCQARRGPQDCPAGFKYDQTAANCVDVDECEEKIDGCSPESEVCRNTMGGYECYMNCEEGFEFSLVTGACADVDECAGGLDTCPPGQTCVNEPGTFRCQPPARCPPGYRPSLLHDVDCEDIDECAERLDNCSRSRDQLCQNTEGGFNCIIRCRAGYRFSLAQARCQDIDECADGTSNCTAASTCVNTEGSFTCRPNCPVGYRANPSGNCDDIDECAEGTATCRLGQSCLNQAGSYTCVTNTTCPAGYQYSYASRSCQDIDECVEGTDDCNPITSTCTNTEGGFSCTPRAPCSDGYRFNDFVQTCADIDECQEGSDTCNKATEYCVNTPGSYSCSRRSDRIQCATGFRLSAVSGICDDIDECAEGLDSCRPPLQCVNIRGSFTCTLASFNRTVPTVGGPQEGGCAAGFRLLSGRCVDIDECRAGAHLCVRLNERCVNEEGGYRCVVIRDGGGGGGPPTRPSGGGSDCGPGLRYSAAYQRCVDVDECTEQRDVCGPHGRCINTRGDFNCQCNLGFKSDKDTKRCIDMNECQLDIHSCVDNQRCDNTIGSFSCIRTSGCGTGYTLNSQLGVCEDDDECELGRDNCASLGPKWVCNNIEGSFRCVKKRCSYGERLAADGRCVSIDCQPGYRPDQRGQCRDVDECENDPCGANFQCINTPGSFSCQSRLQCQRGYRASEDGSTCVDIDECSETEGRPPCSADQTCTNKPGGYECSCQTGYIVNRYNQCEDVDECRTYGDKVCGRSSQCVNTPGSYICRCSEGYKQGQSNRICVDMDECKERPGICHQQCYNTRGSYRCACENGYRLHTDKRNCIDVDECEEARQLSYGSLCVGLCVNEPGSFRCECPSGYVLGPESRQCQDVNECSGGNVCRADEVCLNTRGGYRCNRIDCPPNYERDDAHRNRCKRKSLFCRDGDRACQQRPVSYSYNFLTFISKLPVPRSGRIDLFTMRGPLWTQTTVRFQLRLVDARAPSGVARARDSFFRLRRLESNQAVVSLIRSIEGPQEIELELTMDLYQGARFSGKAVAKLFVFVTKYEF